MKTLLTDVIATIVNDNLKRPNSFGVSIINLPDLDFVRFIARLADTKKLELYFLGYSEEFQSAIKESLPNTDKMCSFYSVEDAEESRNIGADDIFRIHFIKNTELEKISSLKWYTEIDMEQVYKRSCQLVLEKLPQKNETIKNLLHALKRKDIRTLLNFERVLDYLETLISINETSLPSAVSSQLYRLDLLADPSFAVGAPTIEQLRDQIKKNHATVRRISNLEQKERQHISNYLAKNPDNNVVRLILDYYRSPSVELLKQMDLSEVEKCLKAVSSGSGSKTKPQRKSGSNPTVATSQMIFDGNDALISRFVDRAQKDIDDRPEVDRSCIKSIEVDGVKIDIPVQASTEKLVQIAVSDMKWGGIIEADVASPKEALDNAEKYGFEHFDSEYVQRAKDYLLRASSFPEAAAAASSVLTAFDCFLTTRMQILPLSKRLQDMPMLQVAAKCSLFSEYLKAYERLLAEIKDNFKDLYELDSTGAKQVITTILSLDLVYIIGRSNSHAIPTPLNPLYLWKYTKLAEEMLNSRGVPEGGECFLSEEDKEFIIRKAEDIPDPLALIMLPKNNITHTECLPYSGRLGCLPVYSTKPQINDSSTGLDSVHQGIIRYMCLYPHSSMMLRVSIINPPTVDSVVTMLKKLDRDKEFSAFGKVGVDLTIYRTKETSPDWIELEDKALSEGMLGKVKDKRSGSFNLSIKNRCLSYSDILQRITREQHIVVIFDPNEREIDIARNSRNIHIHPLCVPKVYEYNKMQGSVKIRAANEGGIFADYASIIEKLYEQPSTFGHRNVFVNSPLKQETYKALLTKTDWLIILDQNLKSWDVSLQSTSERLYYKSSDYRSIGIYSKNSKKFAMGYQEIISSLGNYIPSESGIQNIISATRSINDDGLLSIVSHSTNQIFDQSHGKGSLGLAIAAMRYRQQYPDSIIVGLDTQLAREWLSDRDDAKLPDLIAIRLGSTDEVPPVIDIIEVKTHADYAINSEGTISGHAVEQASILEALMLEMFGRSEKITTVSRREILREQVFESLFNSASYDANQKQEVTRRMNSLFAGEYSPIICRQICHVDFTASESSMSTYRDTSAKEYTLVRIGAEEIQAVLADQILETQVVPPLSSGSGQKSTVIVADADQSVTVAFGEEVPPLTAEYAALSTPAVPLSTASHATNSSTQNAVNSTTQLVIDPGLHEKCVRLNAVLKSYGIQALPVDETIVQQAARFTRFKVELKPGETEANLKKRSEDIARELEAAGEIFIGRIRGTRYIGLDVPFADGNKPLALSEHLYRLHSTNGALSILAGQTPDGGYQVIDLAKAPHMLIAGTTGSGKTIFLYSILVSLLEQFSADELELLIVDPKQTDFHFFEELPHLRGGRVLTDADEAIEALETINAIDKQERTNIIKAANCRDIDSYNAKNPDQKMKRLVVVIDEYADLVQAAELQGKEVRKSFESNLCMLAQRVRNLGIHLVIATQQPRATIVTSSLKAVLPFRVSFRLPSHTDSQTILDRSGAEDLLGKGDMLMMTDSDTLRMQGFFITEDQLIKFIEKKKD